MANISIPFTTSGDYTFDSSKIEVTGGKAKLKLVTEAWSENTTLAETSIYSLVTYNDKLYAGTSVNGKIYVYDGVSWSLSYDSPDLYIFFLIVYNNKLYAGTESGKIYEYNGSTWSLNHSTGHTYILGMAVYSNKLYVGTGVVGKIFVYDGATWSEAYDDPSTGYIMSLCVYNNKLYAGTNGDGRIVVYDGVSWTDSYDSTEQDISTLGVYNNKLYAGTYPNGKVFVYDGVSWSLSYDSSATNIYNLTVYNNKLYAGSTGDGVVFVYDGVSWTESYNSTASTLYGLGVYNNRLYAGAFASGKIYVYKNGYETDLPSIYKTLGDTATDVINWSNFVDTPGTLEGSLGYELSNDGTNWKYWNGSTWAAVTADQYNTEATVNTNISTFSITGSKIYVKTFLISDGAQQVEVDQIDISFVDNQLPLCDAGTNKVAVLNEQIAPFSNSTFSDPNGSIVKAEYKVIGEVDIWTEIQQGLYGSLLEAVQTFEYGFNNEGSVSVQLKVTDDQAATAEDSLTVTVSKTTMTITVLDGNSGQPISDINFTPGDGGVEYLVSSPFIHNYGLGTFQVILTKVDYNSLIQDITIDQEDDTVTLTMIPTSPPTEVVQQIDIEIDSEDININIEVE